MSSKPIKVNNLAVIGIYVSDLDDAKDFYINQFGLEDRGVLGMGWVLGLGDTSFYLEPGRDKNPENLNLNKADITFCFGVDSVKETFDEVNKRGIQIATAYTEFSSEFAFFMIADPDGNIIEFAGKP